MCVVPFTVCVSYCNFSHLKRNTAFPEALTGADAEVETQSAWSNALSDTSWATAAAKACMIAVPEHCDVAPTKATARNGSFRSALPDSPSQAFAIPLQTKGTRHSCTLAAAFQKLTGVHSCRSMCGHSRPHIDPAKLSTTPQRLSLGSSKYLPDATCVSQANSSSLQHAAFDPHAVTTETRICIWAHLRSEPMARAPSASSKELSSSLTA